jgi:membrane protein DedA with SNARE-associated domain
VGGGRKRASDSPRRRPRLPFLLVPIAGLVVASNVGSALAPSLVNDHPLTLLALDARNRHLVLVANSVDAVPYFVVGAVRLMLADPLFYLLGFFYGEPALRWLDRRGGSIGRFLRAVERFFAKASYPLVFLAPNNYICLFAGASRMPPPVFLALNLAGTLVRLTLFRLLGEALERPIDAVLDFIGRNQLPLTAVTVTVVVVQVLWDRRRGSGELEALAELEDEIEGDARDAPPPP